MEIELHVTVPGQGRAVLTGRGKDTFHMRFSVRGTAGATAWVKDLFKVPHSGYCPAMGGPWAGRIGGRLPILIMAIVNKQTFGECNVAFVRLPSDEELPPPSEYDELTPPPELIQALHARSRHRPGKPTNPPKRPAPHIRHP